MADTPKATERQARTPLPRDCETPERPRFRSPSMRFLLLIGLLPAINYAAVARFAPGKVKPVRAPYSPTFLQQVRDRNVERISTQGATVEGLFKKEVKYGKQDASKNFETE